MGNGRVTYDLIQDNTNPLPEDDVEAAYNEWRADIGDTESPGVIRAFRIPLDDQGQASHSAKNQVRLGAWPIDAYTFDELCEKIKVEFMLPNEKTMAVRFLGSTKGTRGVGFNKLIVMQRANSVVESVTTAAGTGSVAEILQAMQQSQAATLRMIQEMTASRPQNDTMHGMMQFAAMYKMMMEPMAALMAGRAPGTSADPIQSMKGMLEAMTMLDDLRGGGGGGRGSSETAEIIKAVAGVGTPLLQLAVQANAQKPPPVPRPRVNAVPRPQPNPVPPAPLPHAASVQGNTPPAHAHAPVGVDLTRPSPLPPGSLSPGPDINVPSNPHSETTVNFAETKARIDAFVAIAESGADPAAVADTFFQQEMMSLDDDAYSQLAANIDDPEFVNQISIFNSKVKEQRPFFEALRVRLSQRIDEESQAAEQDMD